MDGRSVAASEEEGKSGHSERITSNVACSNVSAPDQMPLVRLSSSVADRRLFFSGHHNGRGAAANSSGLGGWREERLQLVSRA